MFDKTLTVSEASDVINETLKAAVPALIIEGEVSGFNVNRGKFVFFDLKDDGAILPCFMMAFALNFPIEDGMKVRVLVESSLTAKGRFSLTVRQIQPIGEGSLKKAFELLKKKLSSEDLFDVERKRTLPEYPSKIGVVSSSGAAGWADFSKILNERWGGLEVELADVTVQGLSAPGEVVKAIEHFNSTAELPDVLVVIRGGGSADDLAAFSSEEVVRAVAASRVPTVLGIGHETDQSLAELAADVVASTPSNAAQLVVPDKKDFVKNLEGNKSQMQTLVNHAIEIRGNEVESINQSVQQGLKDYISSLSEGIRVFSKVLKQVDPQAALQRGYSITRSGSKILSSVKDVKMGENITVDFKDGTIGAKVNDKS
jgi:exodeoxyribonuclease VII large subunit